MKARKDVLISESHVFARKFSEEWSQSASSDTLELNDDDPSALLAFCESDAAECLLVLCD
jgi:hypothetical protein